MLLPGPGCRREVLLAGSRITFLSPFSHLVLVMKTGMFPSQFSAETALSSADCMGCFFLFQPPDTGNTGQSLVETGGGQKGLVLLEAVSIQSLARFAKGSSISVGSKTVQKSPPIPAVAG